MVGSERSIDELRDFFLAQDRRKAQYRSNSAYLTLESAKNHMSGNPTRSSSKAFAINAS
jgi:hypothetical protein